MSEFNCGTGCQDPKHMLKCDICGAVYHVGVVHLCPTGFYSYPEKEKSIHAHCAWFGSELACRECNPVCWQNHQMENPNHLKWCGEEKCPLNPKRFKKQEPSEEMKKKMAEGYEENAEEDLALAKEFENTLPEGLEEDEDSIRLSKRKSIRYGGKYKGRHHGSKKKEC